MTILLAEDSAVYRHLITGHRNESTPIRTPLKTTTVTVSLGVAVAEPTSNSESLLRLADLALYQAKRHGRNRVAETIATAGEAVGRS